MPGTLPPGLQIPKVSYWNTDVTVRTSSGYRDNPTLSSSGGAANYAFWAAGGDLLTFRLPVNGWQFSAFGTYNYLNYVPVGGASSASAEQTGMALGQLTKDWGGSWKTGGSVSAFYQDQVVDTTVTQTNGSSVTEIVGENLTGRWFVRKTFQPGWSELTLSLSREWLAAPLDGFWQPGARLAVGRDYGQRGSAVSLFYQWALVDFDTREQTSASGFAVPGTRLRFQTHSTEFLWQQGWDAAKRWQTVTRAGLDWNQDNGAGYYDYWQYHLAEELKYHPGTWDFALTAGVNYYDFTVQQASQTDDSLRRKTSLAAGIYAGKRLGKSFKVFANASYEHSISNAGYDAYTTTTTSAGLEYHF